MYALSAWRTGSCLRDESERYRQCLGRKLWCAFRIPLRTLSDGWKWNRLPGIFL